ncbi:MAG: thermonuclease family protein [Pseudomonadota bacterium]
MSKFNKKRQVIHLTCLFLCPLLFYQVLISISFLFLSNLSYANCKNLPIAETVRYQTIFDGDTILLKDGRKIRLIGINTPEIGRKGRPSQAFAQKAKQTLRLLLSQSQYLHLAYDVEKKDRYKRTLAYIYLQDGTDVQAKLLLSGLATSIVVKANEKNLSCYRRLEEKARKKHLGIWQQKKYKSINAINLTAPRVGSMRRNKSYRFVRGKVTYVKRKSHHIILKLEHNLSIKLSGKAFLTYQYQKLLGLQIQVRGIVYAYRKKPGMSIYHPANIIIL